MSTSTPDGAGWVSDGKGGGQYLVAMPCNVPLVHGDKPAPVVVKKKGKVEAASWQRMMGVLHFLGTNGARDLLLSLVALWALLFIGTISFMIATGERQPPPIPKPIFPNPLCFFTVRACLPACWLLACLRLPPQPFTAVDVLATDLRTGRSSTGAPRPRPRLRAT
jgi:hypothetical protein